MSDVAMATIWAVTPTRVHNEGWITLIAYKTT